MPGMDLSNLKVADLKRELKEGGLPLTGNKNELQERLQAAMDGEPLLEDASITGEDILVKEEGVLSDKEKIVVVDDNELLQNPSANPTMLLPKTSGGSNDAVLAEDDVLGTPTTIAKKVVLKHKISSGPTSTEATNVTAKENTESPAEKAIKKSQTTIAKKVVLKRKISSGPTSAQSANVTAKENTEPSAEKVIKGSPTTIAKKVVLKRKISSGPTSAKATNVTAKENTEPPAGKVIKRSQHVLITADGSTTTATTRKLSELTMEERLELRAKKFGIDKTAAVKDGKVELLKKRAERFGCVKSTNLVKLDAEEKLLKRKQRFGGDFKDAPADANSGECVEKDRRRLVRFKDAAGAEMKTSVPEVRESRTPPPAAAAATYFFMYVCMTHNNP